jgi:SAM-dependent methyltransferase
METVSCNLCGANDSELVLEGKDRLYGIEGTFRLVRCRRCGLIYLNPRPGPDEMARYYPSDYIAYYRAIEDEPSFLRRLDRRYGLHKRCRQVIRRADGPGRLLDVGCATGVFLDGMRQRGWTVTGVEVNAEAARYARERLGLEVFADELEKAGYPDASFDVVTLWDVLEHVRDPQRTLGEIARILRRPELCPEPDEGRAEGRPGGLLVLSLPNPDCLEARLFGPYWAGWDVPRHLYIFSLPVLERLLSETGFQIQEVHSFTGRYHVLVLSTQLWVAELLASQRFRQLILAVMRSWPARGLALPWYALADRWNQSSIMTVFARRR